MISNVPATNSGLMARRKLLCGAPGRLLLCKIMCETAIVGAHQGAGGGPWGVGRVIEWEPGLVFVIVTVIIVAVLPGQGQGPLPHRCKVR